jgi:hypothetical protein
MGDSGGPAFFNDQIAGIASWSTSDEQGRMSNYINVNSHDGKIFFQCLKNFGVTTPVSDSFLAEFQTEPCGFYQSNQTSCQAFFISAKVLNPAGRTPLWVPGIEMKHVGEGCNLPSRFACSDSECTADGVRLSHFTSEGFEVTAADGSKQTFNLIHKTQAEAFDNRQRFFAWDEKEPNDTGACVRIMANGLWRDSKCDMKIKYACVRWDFESWQLQDEMCSNSHNFIAPRNAEENNKLKDAMAQAGVAEAWINVKRRKGTKDWYPWGY